MQITLTADIENILINYAKYQGIRPEMLALNVLREWFAAHSIDESASDEKGTLADYLADHIGVISSKEHVLGGAQMSEGYGKRLTPIIFLGDDNEKSNMDNV